MEFTASEVIAMATVICTASVAIINVWGSIIISRINAKSTERIRNNELYIPMACNALDELSAAYAKLPRADAWSKPEYLRPPVDDMICAYKSYIAASYKVMSFVPDAGVQQDMSALMDRLAVQDFLVHAHDDALYRKIVEQVMPYIQSVAPVKQYGIFRGLLRRFKRRAQ